MSDIKRIKCARDLAFKAFCDGLALNENEHFDRNRPTEMEERFNNWWSQWFYEGHKESFLSNNENNVYVNGKRYIPAD